MIKDFKKYSILVVEDNLGDFTIVEDFLSENISNPKISQAKNYKEAAAFLLDKSNHFDVILLDLTLPDLNGTPLISQIIKLSSSCPIIILTGFTDIDFSIQSISLGVSDYLLKDDLNALTLYKSIIYAIERKKTFIQLEESERRYSDLFHLSPQPMWVYDLEDLSFLSVNQAAVNSYGYSEQEFLSMTIKEIRPPEDIYLLEEALKNLRNRDSIFSKNIFRHRKRNGEIIQVEILSNSFCYNNKEAMLVLANDITSRVQHISAIEEQNKKLQEIAYTQSHIVRAPLARMMGIANLLKELKLITEEGNILMGYFVESSVELDGIIRDIVKKSEQIKIQ
ncbi:PAS domain-containing response regulator [Pedobacter cryophilus]|uniref:Response regulator n=1 Tax=Pedobacter cryophilus TaxID=2571271 RepID=A0A4U1BX33_9SPHI|nr:response regulator [Pedobacter cryophilus]TKB95983.1 response regulator [Pedobacter cryophilus]